MKERDFLNYVLDVAARGRWRAWHVPMPVQRVKGGDYVPDPRGAGIPDLILMHDLPPLLVFAELKVGAPLSDAQREFLELAGHVARVAVSLPTTLDPYHSHVVGAYVWTWPDSCEELERVLLKRELTRPPAGAA